MAKRKRVRAKARTSVRRSARTVKRRTVRRSTRSTRRIAKPKARSVKARAMKQMSHTRSAAVSGDSKTFAFVSTFFSIVGFILAIILWRNDRYVMHYARQGLVLFIVAIVVGILQSILFWIPVLGALIASALNIAVFVLWIMTWVYALSGEKKNVPIVGDYAKHINL